MFRKEDIEDLKVVHYLLKEKGMTIAGARKRIKDNFEGEKKNVEVINILTDIRDRLLEIKSELS